MIRRPPRSTLDRSSAASDVYKRQLLEYKKYKEVAEDLNFMESNQRKVSYRGNFSHDEMIAPPEYDILLKNCLLYTSPSPRDRTRYRMPSSA